MSGSTWMEVKSMLSLASGAHRNLQYQIFRTSKVTENAELIKLLTTLVPDEIIYLKENEQELTYSGVLFVADVSGFTDLCERYNQLGKGGASKLTHVLNEYMGAMVQEIIVHNGDILKFSGDAFLALWKSTNNRSIKDAIHSAIDCALVIQRSHGTYKTEVDVILKVKIGIAVGQIIFTVIESSTFMILGNTMFEVKDIGNISGPGEILITPAVRTYLTSNEYTLSVIPNGQFIKVLGIGHGWSPSQLGHDILETLIDTKLTKLTTSFADNDQSTISYISADYKDISQYTLRPSFVHAVNNNLEKFLRRFIISPVIRAIDLGEPLEYLTEMRQVVIVFINIVTKVNKMKQLQDLCNFTYSTVSELVLSDGGCVNKVSMFDKDLMFLVIFGLRGFKHNLETQRALYCAKKIRDKLVNVTEIVSTSCGVTTGLTYCGVVGHQIRKEYTVIGRTVNKAARLMVAYPDMVSCDQQSFLASQLQLKYFTLQPYSYLKGFKHVGPIYRFDDDNNTDKQITKTNEKTQMYPLLDRNNEMLVILNTLATKTKMSSIRLLSERIEANQNEYNVNGRNYNMLIIKGEPRQGKTRILNEIIYYIENELPIYHCAFSALSTKKYNIFRCIFNETFNLSNLTSPNDISRRTRNVWKLLQPFKAPEFLCALNEILNVNFEVSKYFLTLSDEEKMFVRAKMIKYLTRKIFKNPMVILIDNIEHMDPDSWDIYKIFLNSGRVFTCATLGIAKKLNPEAEEFIKRDDILTLELKPITKWYQTALICQFLNVQGVSLEIEKYIQMHSNGNPGWIESFLTTLVHSKGIEIKKIYKKEAYELGIVMPSPSSIYRDSPDCKTSHISILSLKEQKNDFFFKYFDVDIEGWDIYRHTIKEDISDETLEIILICNLAENFSLEEIDVVDYLDVQMLQTYDSLKVSEQQLLKCCSILGDSFERSKLEYVMQNKDLIKNALAIQRLFEIQVFSCARGNYNGGSVLVKHHLTNPNLDLEVKCECEGFPKNLSVPELPKYANCGYIRFREPNFRQMLMNLLTDAQANLYHVRAIWFLESQTRKCLACGRGYFAKINGQNNDDGMKKYSTENIPDRMTSKKRKKRVSGIEFYKETSPRNTQDISAEVYSSSEQITYHAGIKHFRVMRVRNFTENNMKNCMCQHILTTMYTQMIEHSKEAEKNETLMHALLEFATLCIKFHNIIIAFTLLRNATTLLDKKLRYEYQEPSWDVPLTKGRILCLQGLLHIEREAYSDAESCLMASLKTYNLHFPKIKTMVTSKINIMKLKQKLILKYFANSFIGNRDTDICMLAEQTSETLSYLYILYKRTSQYDKAYLASIWSLTEALRSDSNFNILCVAYCNSIKMDMLYHRPDILWQLEDMAMLMCYRKHTRLVNDEFDAMVNMYNAIFMRKCHCESYSTPVRLGNIIMTLGSPSFGKNFVYNSIPFVIRCLTFTINLKLIVRYILEVLNSINTNDEDTVLGNYSFQQIDAADCITLCIRTSN